MTYKELINGGWDRVRDCNGKPTARRRRCEDLKWKARPL